eukprot:scaffold637_cov118-Isochrysis_galbana.AAC.4
MRAVGAIARQTQGGRRGGGGGRHRHRRNLQVGWAYRWVGRWGGSDSGVHMTRRIGCEGGVVVVPGL